MPSSGYNQIDIAGDLPREQCHKLYTVVTERAKVAMSHGMFIEWLESFLGAWASTKDAYIASWSGLEEWDM